MLAGVPNASEKKLIVYGGSLGRQGSVGAQTPMK
jgi:hypothetical protein